MFRLGETYETESGDSVRIICVDSGIKGTDLVGVVTAKGASSPVAVWRYDSEGNCNGNVDPVSQKYRLISKEPTEEEAALIREIGDYCERQDDQREERLLKIIRQLRKK